ncbi:MAG: AAA family ATPase [Methylococcales bacterium]|nr:AAA family ATPase [Methylococcales bacterium]
MKFDVKVKNLGRIKEAEFKIRSMTVITGTNGTGKSFFTKSLYSIFNVINKNVYHESISKTIRDIQLQLLTLASNVNYPSANDVNVTEEIRSYLDGLQNEFEAAYEWKIDDYLYFTKSKVGAVSTIRKRYISYLDELNQKPLKINSVRGISETISQNLSILVMVLTNSTNFYKRALENHVKDELLENFQISDTNELIRFGEQQIEIKIDDLLTIEISDKKLSIDTGSDFIDDVTCLSSVVFFESPAYWKVRDALKGNPFIRMRQNDTLSGVPKYFSELDEALNKKTKKSGDFENIAQSLEETLGGEFIFKNDSLSFKDSSGREISKNLVSFGMTNLGMIHALLKQNVITKGSFVFIDEPETNLHPDWQVKLVNVLLALANADVYVVITTHSTDIIKALEVNIKKLPIDSMDEFLSVHFMDTDGTLCPFDAENPQQQLTEARNLLNSAYEQLYFSDF